MTTSRKKKRNAPTFLHLPVHPLFFFSFDIFLFRNNYFPFFFSPSFFLCVCGTHLYVFFFRFFWPTKRTTVERTHKKKGTVIIALPEPHYLWAEPIFLFFLFLEAPHNRSGELSFPPFCYHNIFLLFFFLSFFPNLINTWSRPFWTLKKKKKKMSGFIAAHPVAFISVSPAGSPDQIRRLNVIIQKKRRRRRRNSKGKKKRGENTRKEDN